MIQQISCKNLMFKSYENGSYHHFAESRHATIALTDEAVLLMKSHAETEEKPLFLYLSYNAAHSPLQPEESWLKECQSIPHLWRRQYCGMMIGLDWGIKKVTDAAQNILGENTIIVVSSDNGGSVWFGGLNEPLRSGKHTSFEGGVRVPAFAVDLSNGNYLGRGGREYQGLVHISDWLPTFMSLAKSSHLLKDIELDGIDQSEALSKGKRVRLLHFLEGFSYYPFRIEDRFFLTFTQRPTLMMAKV